MWDAGVLGSAGGGGSQTQIGVEWFGTTGMYQKSSKITDITMGTLPAHIIARPPPNSSPSFWISQGGDLDNTNTLIAINGPLGTVVDLVMDCVLVDNEAQSAGPTTTGMTTGTVYYNYLDGRGSGNIQPFSGVRTIT